MIRTILFFFLTAILALAQETSGSISGIVKDGSGAAVPGAQVMALHTDTGETRTVKAGSDGDYAFPDLPIGAYQITAQHTGFKRAVKKGVVLHVSDRIGFDITLEVGELAQEVTVSANVEQVETESSEQGSLVTGDQVRELQLNGRSFMTLLELVPGVSSDMPDRADPNTKPTISVNGGRPSGSSFNIDGATNADIIIGGGAMNTFTSVETIAEFKVVTSSFSAEYGRGGFSQINVVTKGGTQTFHGSLYEFFRNDALDARDYFTHQVLPLRLNNFGYTLGGPLVLPHYNKDKRKTFFFWTQEFSRVSERGDAVNTTVPGVAERKGDFSSHAAGTVVDPTTGASFPGGIIPASRMDPNGVKLASLYPAPNWQGPGTVNFTSALAGRQNWREELIRLDHIFSPSWRVYGRYSQDTADINNPYGGSLATSVSSKLPNVSATDSARPGKNVVFDMTNLFGPTMLNQFSFSYTSRVISQAIANPQLTRTGLGINIPEVFPQNDQDLIPQINLTNYASITTVRATLKQLFSWDFKDNLSKTIGPHVLKAGVLYSFGGNREQNSADTNGTLSFNTTFSKDPVANLLLGLPYQYTEDDVVLVSRIRFGILEGYAQDDFRASRRLTLNAGLRWSNYFNPYDTKNMITNFVPSLYNRAKAVQLDKNGRPIPGIGDPLNGIVVGNVNSPWGRRVTQNNYNLFGPRFGFAYDLLGDKKTALRGGAGVYYTRPMLGAFINNSWTNPPFGQSIQYNNPQMGNPSGGVVAAVGVPALTTLGTPLIASKVYQWSLGIQQDLLKQAMLSVSYVGNRGLHLMQTININNPQPGAAAAQGIPMAASRPYIGYGNINERQMSGSSIYHSLQVTLNRRMSRRFMFGLSYTFSKAIDTSSGERGSAPPNSYDLTAERAVSDYDRPHILSSNFIWNLPNASKNRNSVPGFVLNGWQLSGITRMYSGKPFDVVLSTDVAGIGQVQNQRPDVIGDTSGPRTVEQWFNKYAFARPKNYTFGNMGRNSLRGPGIDKWDLSLFKNFMITEGKRLQFRAEAFNALNHPSFTNPGATLNTTATIVRPDQGNFAIVTNTRDARVFQFALKLMF